MYLIYEGENAAYRAVNADRQRCARVAGTERTRLIMARVSASLAVAREAFCSGDALYGMAPEDARDHPDRR
jgi:hypothetical protein